MQPLLQWKNNAYYVFWVCVCTLLCNMECAFAILSFVACPTLQYFSTLSHKRHDFRKKKKVLYNTNCVLIFSTTLSGIFCLQRRIERDMSKMYIGRHVKFSLFLSCINETWIFSTAVQKYSYNKLHESPFSNELFYADRRTDGQTDGQRNRRTDRHNEANCRFPQLRECA